MHKRTFALIAGIVFLGAGFAGFVPALLTPLDRELAVPAMQGRLLGLFPTNVLHNLFHIAFGVWGIIAYRNVVWATLFARTTAVIYGLLIIAGLIPMLDTMFGLIPIYGHDVWLHAILAVAAAYFGFFTTEPEAERVAAGKAR